MKRMKKLFDQMKVVLVVLTVVFVTSCKSVNASNRPISVDTPSSEGGTVTGNDLHKVTTLKPSATASPVLTETSSATPSPTSTSTVTPTPTWIAHEAGEVEVPIFLYHHVSDEKPGNRYYVTTKAFEDQMKLLRESGYTSISASKLLDVLIHGGELPPKPVVLTFDDGHMSIYQNAFPIMEKYGFTGVFYIVGNRIGSKDFVGVKELKTMIAHGWEIGSHSMTRPDLTANHDAARFEMFDSKTKLEEKLGIKVNTIAYPYGKIDAYIADRAQEYGYLGGMGLGVTTQHTWGTMFYLSRLEVFGDEDLDHFAAHLPWSNR